jgi:ribonuclease HII
MPAWEISRAGIFFAEAMPCSFDYESRLWDSGVRSVAGVDEAGRGPLAGPVVAAAVVFKRPIELPGLDDSKRMRRAARERVYDLLLGSPDVSVSHAVVGEEVIDRINILRASQEAMRRAVSALHPIPEHALIDGLPVHPFPMEQTAIVKGDGLSFSIAAASVIAKVTRDKIMAAYAIKFPQYGFDQHQGYATATHLAMLRAHGPCRIHRRSFAPVAQTTLDI